jgi:hypothetical protein
MSLLVIAFILNSFQLSEEVDPLHGYNYTRRYPIGKGGQGVKCPQLFRRGEDPRRERAKDPREAGPRSEAGKGEGLARGSIEKGRRGR